MARNGWFVLALLFASCGGDEEGDGAVTGIGACDESEFQGDCVVYTGSGWTLADVANNCSEDLKDSCPTPGQVGECLLDAGGEFETVSYFYEPQWRQSEARNACLSSGGEWTEL